jgi:nucleotide-binding universal stress UspA family protein
MATTNPVAVTFEHILVPTDFSEVSQRALEYAKTLAKRQNAELLLAHVEPPANLLTPPEAAWIDDSEIQSKHAEELEQSNAALISEGYKAKAISLTGSLYDELLHAIQEYKVDLIVLGTHGRKGLDRFLLGSDAEAMLRRTRCPVLSVGTEAPDLKHKMWSIREVLCATTFDPGSAEVAAFAHKLAAMK